MKIRDALENEVPEIRKQRINSYSEHKEAIPDAHWQALKKAISTEADRASGVELIVAEIDKKVVGSVALFPAKADAYEGFVEALQYPEIRVLAVTPEARGQGVATALISECIHRAKVKGYDLIGLHTGDFMKDAMKLYNKIGFKRLPQYDFKPADDGIIVKAFCLPIK